MGLKFERAPDSPGRLVKTPMAGLHLQFDSVSLGWGLRKCSSNKFPGDADVTDSGTTLPEPLP